MDTDAALKLPIAVVSPIDVARLLRELESLDEFFRQSAIRSGDEPETTPRYSRLLDEVVVANSLNLLQPTDRESLISSLSNLSGTAPILHISFSADPPGPYVQKIVGWLRENIDEMILVRVGLQPNIAAGCIVRTDNRSFDFSLRKYFESKHDFFMEKLHEVLLPEESAVMQADRAEQQANQSAVTESQTPESTPESTQESPEPQPEAVQPPPQPEPATTEQTTEQTPEVQA